MDDRAGGREKEEGEATPLTKREELAILMEGCIEEMKLANEHLGSVFSRVQVLLLEENRALTREKAIERMRAKIPEPQKTIDQVAREVKKKGGEQPAGKD